MSLVACQVIQAATQDGSLDALTNMDAILTIQLFATLAGLSLASAVFLMTSRDRLKELHGDAIDERYGSLDVYRKAVLDLESGGRSLFLAFYTFVAGVAVAFAVDGTFESALSGNINLESLDVGATGSLFGLGLLLLWFGAWKINQYYKASLKKR